MMTQMLMGGSGGVTLIAAPTSRTNSAMASSFTFASITITVVGGTASAYNWTLVNPALGTWSVNSGQSTATAAARVISVNAADEATCDFTCTVTVSGVDYSIAAPHSFLNTT